MKNKLISVLLVLALVFTACGAYGSAGTSEVSAADASKYLIKVNKQRNVVTVYMKKHGQYKPYRSMLCSTGGGNTPSGTHHLSYKFRWHTLMGPSWGQYCTVFCGDCLFHSVWYYQNHNKAVCSGAEYNRLGQSRSHGCIRLSVMDAKWIYENCPGGTTVKIFRSSSTGPLGKPKGLKVSGTMAWDPTDPDPRNPDFRIKKPQIKMFGKNVRTAKKTVSYSKKKSVRLKTGIKAENINAYQDLTDKVKIKKMFRKVNGKWKKISNRGHIRRKNSGKYKIIFSVHDKYCGGSSRAKLLLTIKEKPQPKPKPIPEPDPEQKQEQEQTEKI